MLQIGLFPLELVLLPGERVPLHIFEPRYRELIGECLESGAEFGLVLSDADGLRRIGTRAGVEEVLQRFQDGRLNVLVSGRERFRILAETEGRTFQTAEVEPLHDEDDAPGADEVRRSLALFDALAEAAGADGVERPDPSCATLSFELAGRVALGVAEKQALLELRSERKRLERLGRLFGAVLRSFAAEREIRERAAGNGKPVLRTDQQAS